MAQLNLHANVANGIYSVIEVILTLLLIRILRVLLACHNLHTIYDARKPLHLKATRVSLLMEIGLAPHLCSMISVLVGFTFAMLCTAGGFAFTGITVPAYEPVQVRNKVVAATPGTYIDFRDHISSNASLFSATFAILVETGCVESGTSESTIYSRTNEIHDLNTVKWPRGTFFSNYTCLWEPNGFKSEILTTRRDGGTGISLAGCDLDFSTVGVNSSEVKRNETTQIPFSENVDLGDCPFRIIELWCSNYRTLRCAGSLLMTDDLGGYGEILYFLGPENGALSATVSELRLEQKDDTEVLKSIAFISDFLVQNTFTGPIRQLAMFRIETNATVQRNVGERDVTDVNVTLIAATFGTALGMFALVSLVALQAWVRVIWLKGRRRYNTFCSKADALACAAQQYSWARETEAAVEEGHLVRAAAAGNILVKREMLFLKQILNSGP